MEDGLPKQGPKPGLLTRILRSLRKNSLSPLELEEEMHVLINHGAESGALPKSSKEMIHSIFEFDDTVAKQIMTPRIAVVGVDKTATIAEVVEIVKKEGYSRLPVYEGDLDHIVGFLMVKDLLKNWGSDPNALIPTEFFRPVTLVHANRLIGDILTELRLKKSHIAVVLDEYGGTAGLVTMEDIIEEIIGDINDEYDQEEDENIKELSPGVILANGQATISELNGKLPTPLPAGDYETLGGFLTDQVSRVPIKGEDIVFSDYVFHIKAADSRKVDQVEITSRPQDDLKTNNGKTNNGKTTNGF
ncbi:MAG: hemolysin family protein [Deltaproteobacteria bacterium]|nr:hemolysin family protein [Deltaproteobacteria bacterium]